MPRIAMLQPWWLLVLLPSVLSQSNITDEGSMLWGAYRPNLYFGLRPQIPQSLMTGLLWFGTHDYQAFTR
jgi:mannosyl-oligosaccharide glucosidase